jgi:Rod binding domain-containing protein
MQLSVLPDFALEHGEASLDALRRKARDPAEQRERLKKAAKEFEGIMLEMMFKEMRKTVPESPLFGKSNARDIYTDMLDSQYVRLVTDHGGLGLAKLLVRQLGPDLPGGGKAAQAHGAHGAHPGAKAQAPRETRRPFEFSAGVRSADRFALPAAPPAADPRPERVP